MELPRRTRGDELLKSGEMLDLRSRLRRLTAGQDLSAVVACAFDHRTRMLPFIYADTRMAPAGVRAIGSALVDSGIEKVRIVLQQWNKRFDPAGMRLDGRVPDLFCVSSMGMHSQEAMRLIGRACTIEGAERPLIVAGGPKAVYEPWGFFGGPGESASADVVVTGEEFVFLSLMEAVLDARAEGEPLRSAFLRAKAMGSLDDIPGLVFPMMDQSGAVQDLVDTGVQRLLGDLDELPDPVIGFGLLEAPGRSAELVGTLATDKVRRRSPIASMTLTYGCKFACPYCPIPAYNQRQHRLKSPERIADEMDRLSRTYGLKYYFGADDNFFNDHDRTMAIVDELARREGSDGFKPLRQRVRWHTEVTVHDTLKLRDQLPTIRESGCRGLWLGVEDMTATLVKKGQNANKTLEAFDELCKAGIAPHPMMMHHDSQPLYSPGSNYGIVNQVNALRKGGAMSVQVLMLVPAPGSKLYKGTYESGMAFDAVAGREVEPWMHDGNYVIASEAKRPWQKQVNLWLAYAAFYNPWSLLTILLRSRKKDRLRDRRLGMQLVGMLGLTQNLRRTGGWMLRLMTGRWQRATKTPGSAYAMRSPDGGPAEHAPETHVPGGASAGVVTPTIGGATIVTVPGRVRQPAASGQA